MNNNINFIEFNGSLLKRSEITSITAKNREQNDADPESWNLFKKITYWTEYDIDIECGGKSFWKRYENRQKRDDAFESLSEII